MNSFKPDCIIAVGRRFSNGRCKNYVGNVWASRSRFYGYGYEIYGY
jgi:hypothetical protein